MTVIQKKLGMSEEEASNNLKVVEADGVLTLTIALDVKGTASASGKSNVLASSRGNRPIEISGKEGYRLGVNFYQSKD